jgi:hypothetical protein
MPAPFIIISSWEVEEGKVDELKRFHRELSKIIEEKEPQLIAFNAFLNEEGTEMTSIQVHSDAASMEFHLKILREHLGDAMSTVVDFVVPKNIAYYGTLPDSLQASISSRGGDLYTMPVHIAEFTRSPTGERT